METGSMLNLVVPTLIIASMAFLFATIALILIIAQKLSTHKIEWKPMTISDPFVESDKEIEELEDEDSKTLKEVLELQRSGKKKKKEEDPLDSILESNNF